MNFATSPERQAPDRVQEMIGGSFIDIGGDSCIRDFIMGSGVNIVVDRPGRKYVFWFTKEPSLQWFFDREEQ